MVSKRELPIEQVSGDRWGQVCPICSGGGKTLPNEWKKYYETLLQGKHEVAEPKTPKQAVQCGACRGDGLIFTESQKRFFETLKATIERNIEAVVCREVEKQILFAARVIGGTLGMDVDGWQNIFSSMVPAIVAQVKGLIQQEQEGPRSKTDGNEA